MPKATFDYLASLEWVRAAENVCLIGPAGTGKSHLLLALGSAAVDAGFRVRYLTAADLVDTLYRGLADNCVGKVIDGLLRNDLIICDELGFAPLDDTAAQLLFRFVGAAYDTPQSRHRLPLAIRILGPVPPRTHHRRQPPRPTPPPLPHRHHRRRVLPHAPSPTTRRNQDQQTLETRGEEWGLFLATNGDHELAIDTDFQVPPAAAGFSQPAVKNCGGGGSDDGERRDHHPLAVRTRCFAGGRPLRSGRWRR